MEEGRYIRLYGRAFVECEVYLRTGLHIGGAAGALEIGGVDSPVIRDPLTQQPYLPGSSLKGKLRSLSEKQHGVIQNQSIGRDVTIHLCKEAGDYAECPVCPIFGTTGDKPFALPTRLLVRDAFLTAASVRSLEEARTDLPYTEVKWEAAIDRVTAAATPRQIERVPAGAVFAPVQMIISLYQPEDVERLRVLFEAMALLQDDYLGGLGSRGGGQIAFRKLRVSGRNCEDYLSEKELATADDLAGLLAQEDALLERARTLMPREV